VNTRGKKHKFDRLSDSVQEFSDRTGVSTQTLYKMMRAGRLRYVQVTDDLRRIPTTEYIRLGFITDTSEVA
jgi:excisionase family DNA binding protein